MNANATAQTVASRKADRVARIAALVTAQEARNTAASYAAVIELAEADVKIALDTYVAHVTDVDMGGAMTEDEFYATANMLHNVHMTAIKLLGAAYTNQLLNS